jgi:hypothetical protein
MKKLLFGLLATVFLSVGAIGQTLSDVSKKSIVNSEMTVIVHTAKTFYLKGQSYDDFVKNLSIPSPTVPTQDEFFRKVYTYVSNGTTDCDIMKADNSILTRFAMDLLKNPKNAGSFESAYSERKKWWQIAINISINVLLTIFVSPAHDQADLWPEA